MVSTPSPPDPVKTAQAQAGMNRDTAITQQQLNMTDQVNPWGSTTYQQTGTDGFYDSKGKWVETPKYTQTTTYSPEQQTIFDKSQEAQTNLANIAADQSAKVGDILNNPFEFNNQDAENWAYDLASQRILPQQQQATEALRTQLINSGIRPGTEAYNREMTRNQQGDTDQLNQLALNGRSQAFNEALTTRNQPLNEIIGLMSGTQLQNPGTASPSTPQTGVAGVDYTGLVNNQYQAQVANSNAAMGGLFGLASAPFQMFKFSDRRLKHHIRRIGTLFNGLPVYLYKIGNRIEMGLMADEVGEAMPEAVITHPSGFKMVNYDLATGAA
ncbi:MAG: tail fiber domain-containing protein [Rhizobiaceae bacterium]